MSANILDSFILKSLLTQPHKTTAVSVKSGKLQLRAHHAGERHGASKGQPAGLETKGGDREREHHVGGIFVGVS